MSDPERAPEGHAETSAPEPSTAEPRAPLPPPVLLAVAGAVALGILAIPLVYCNHVNGVRAAHEAREERQRAEREERLGARTGASAAGESSAAEPPTSGTTAAPDGDGAHRSR